MMRRVCILTTVHHPFDTRVFHREAKTLLEAGYEVILIARHSSEEIVDGIHIVPLAQPSNRFERMTRMMFLALRLCIRQKADVYHFHDPELIPLGLVLKLIGKRVIYDVHEATPEDILVKEWVPSPLRPLLSHAVGWLEKTCSWLFDHLIVASAYTGRSFSKSNTTLIANYPLSSFIASNDNRKAVKGAPTILIYAGDLTFDRGLNTMLDAANLLKDQNVELHLVGRCGDEAQILMSSPPPNVRYFGFLTLSEVFEKLHNADIGLLVLQPTPAYLHAAENTNKLFEYMACGLPVIASHFDGLKRILENNDCGICIDPANPNELAATVTRFVEDSGLKMRMGSNGLRAVRQKFNWDVQAAELKTVYRQLLEAQ